MAHKKSRFSIGTVDEVFCEVLSEKCIEDFNSGVDDDIFNKTIQTLDGIEIKSNEDIENFKKNK